MSLMPQVDPDAVLADLKGFQRRTAKWVFQRMFLDEDPALRFLVADEVGLGKTHVAKGVVAQVIDHLQRAGDERIDIVYICSNSAIARQNLRKLVPKGIEVTANVERLTMLPSVDFASDSDGSFVNLLAVTPGTSFNFGHRSGRFEERCLAFEFLRQLWGPEVMNARARWIFWYGITAGNPESKLMDWARWYRADVTRNLERFREQIEIADRERAARGHTTLREDFDTLVDGLRWQRDIPKRLRGFRRSFIVEVRRIMAIVGITELKPDLVILDEFQRFKDLLVANTDNFAADLAHRLFSHVNDQTERSTRTLLLSATPYRMYAGADELDGDHYGDFLATCGFLMNDEQQVERLRGDFVSLRRALTSGEKLNEAPQWCERIGEQLRSVMSRTERLASTPDRDGMLQERPAPATIEADDVRSYLRLGSITDTVSYHEPTEYWKSAPYLVNFMDQYELKRSVLRAAEAGTLDGLEAFEPGPGLLDWNEVERYGEIDPQNGRLRWLIDDLNDHRAFELLWVPPSIRYYDAGSIYESPEASSFTKRLIFSGWAVVPKAVSSMVSYEAERSIYRDRAFDYSTDYSMRGGRRLNFRTAERTAVERRRGESDTDRRAAAMTAFVLTWPSPALADLGDPRPFVGSGTTKQQLVDIVQEQIRAAITPVINRAPVDGPVDERWYWAAPMLLDHVRHRDITDVLLGEHGANQWEPEKPGKGLQTHVAEAAALVEFGVGALGRVPDDLADVMTELAIGSPAVCALRALASVTGLGYDDIGAVHGAALVANQMRHFFSAPEVTSVVLAGAGGESRSAEDDGHDDDGDEVAGRYWRDVVTHCIDGNLQALLDEHAHVVRDWRGYLNLTTIEEREHAAAKIASAIGDAVTIRTSTFNVDIPTAASDDGQVSFDVHRMRTRLAAAYGGQRFVDGSDGRIESISTAFNSPFWPFVLVSTSVGQEGLDFHIWCHSVVHWNLPTNPVDLEQREGRVHRYKGHAVRRNIAANLGPGLRNEDLDGRDLWDVLFTEAQQAEVSADDEMIPYWVYTDGPYRIERMVPLLPFSRDSATLPRLRKTLAAYRLAFGQPRQEELVEYLEEHLSQDEIMALVERLRIDLSPACVDQ